MKNEIYASASAFINEFGSASFEPFAIYDKHLDCIRVRIGDCSVIEERRSRIFTVLKPSHSNFNSNVGFNIKGIQHLFKDLGLASAGVFKLADIIDAIVKKYPDTVVKQVIEEFKETIEDKGLEVEVNTRMAA